jgi:hypothetical protein
LIIACGQTEQNQGVGDTANAINGSARTPIARDTVDANAAALARGAAANGKVVVSIGPTSIWLDSTAMREAVRSLGSDAITRAGGEGFALLACFESTAADKTYVTLEAHQAETSPVVTMIIERALSDGSVFTRCTLLAVPASDIRTSLGLRLGMSRADAERILGQPRTAGGSNAQYVLDTLKDATTGSNAASSYHPAVFISITFEADTIVEMSISQGNEIIADDH